MTLGWWTPPQGVVGVGLHSLGTLRTVAALGLAFSEPRLSCEWTWPSQGGPCRFLVFHSRSVLAFPEPRGRPGTWEEGGLREQQASFPLPGARRHTIEAKRRLPEDGGWAFLLRVRAKASLPVWALSRRPSLEAAGAALIPWAARTLTLAVAFATLLGAKTRPLPRR